MLLYYETSLYWQWRNCNIWYFVSCLRIEIVGLVWSCSSLQYTWKNTLVNSPWCFLTFGGMFSFTVLKLGMDR